MKTNSIFLLSGVAALLLATVGCTNDNDLGPSIFDTDVIDIDTTAATADFDQWIYDNFTVPYNVQIQYKFDLASSDLGFELAPADLERSMLLAQLIRYLYYDVYTKYAGESFMKQYGPRIFHFIGSSGYNASTGTEVLGTASGGVKITLYNINAMTPYRPGTVYSPVDVDTLNEKYFHTMHHEFSHILHQTKSYPVTYGQITPGSYDPMTWQERDSVATHQLGYTTHYASSAVFEDFVEMLSGIITDTDYRWMMRIINGSSCGWRDGDRQNVLNFIDSLGINVSNPAAHWNNFDLFSEMEYNEESHAYDIDTKRYVLDVHKNEELVYDDGYKYRYKYTFYKHFDSFNDYLDWVPIATDPDVAGINAILKKMEEATKWYTEQWGLYAFTLRREVRQRQDNINTFLQNDLKLFELK